MTTKAGEVSRLTHGRNPKRSQVWYVFDQASESGARAELITDTPQFSEGLIRSHIRDLQPMGVDAWQCTMEWGLDPIPSEGDVRYSMDGRSGKETVTRSLQTYDQVFAGDVTAFDFGLIGLQPDGQVTGVEIDTPFPVFTVEGHIDFDLIDPALLRELGLQAGKTNSEPWYGHDAYELLFLPPRFDGTRRTGENASSLGRLTLEFLLSESFLVERDSSNTVIPGTGISIPGLPDPISKPGWFVLDVMYRDIVETVGTRTDAIKFSRRIPVAAWSRRPMEAFDFRDLGFGG